MVWEADENPSSMSQSSASPEHEYDQSVVAMAEVPALSPRSALPTQSTQPTKYPLTALVVVSAVVSPPKADSPL